MVESQEADCTMNTSSSKRWAPVPAKIRSWLADEIVHIPRPWSLNRPDSRSKDYHVSRAAEGLSFRFKGLGFRAGATPAGGQVAAAEAGWAPLHTEMELQALNPTFELS